MKKPWNQSFRAYYLLVITILVITVVNQSITQYAFKKEQGRAKVVNLSGKQRMLGQKLLAEYYTCRLNKCNYGEITYLLNKIESSIKLLQDGSPNLNISQLDNLEIEANFERLHPNFIWLKSKFFNREGISRLTEADVTFRVNRFVQIMDEITMQFQIQSEQEFQSLKILELELAIFSILILLFEIFFVVNPIISKLADHKQKLTKLAWHHTHAFSSHMRNINDLKFVLKVEKNVERRQEIMHFIGEELEELNKVSENMTAAFATEKPKNTDTSITSKIKALVKSANKISDGDKARSVES